VSACQCALVGTMCQHVSVLALGLCIIPPVCFCWNHVSVCQHAIVGNISSRQCVFVAPMFQDVSVLLLELYISRLVYFYWNFH
jgi:hypothetical protein